MKSLLKKISVALAGLSVALFAALVPATAFAQVSTPQISDGLNKGTCLSTTTTNCTNPGQAEQSVNDIIEDVIMIFSLVVGVISVIMIIVGGLKYITSGGDSGSVGGAKNTILYAVIGLVVVALAQIVVRFVLSRVEQ
jgi:hypothetical protein